MNAMKYLGAALIVVMVYIGTSSLWPMPKMESSYCDRRYTNELRERQEAAIARALRKAAKVRAETFLAQDMAK